MAISHLQRRIYGPHADIVLQGHGAETDLRNAGAMGFNHLHYYLRGTTFFGWVGGGQRRMPCRCGAANRGSVPLTPREVVRRKISQMCARAASATTLWAPSSCPSILHWNNSRVKNSTCINGFKCFCEARYFSRKANAHFGSTLFGHGRCSGSS